MPLDAGEIQKYLPGFDAELLGEIATYGLIKEVPAGIEILREGQYIKSVPIVLEGLVKVFTRQGEKELLLYYIGSAESCIMSFSSGLSGAPSRIFAITEEPSLILLLPADKLTVWVKRFLALNQLFFHQYDLRYTEMLDTINALLFGRMDHRIYQYLLEKSRLKGGKVLDLRHKQIAAELGTAREVVTRVLKRLEQEGKVRQVAGGIEIN
jgi:CRP/FNR family transcriptional regulator